MKINPVRSYKRWRHGRGFGIHSPFAYDFVTRTLRERLPYYAYSKLDALAAEKWQGVSGSARLRLIFRIAVRFNPATATVIGDRNAALQKVALKAMRRDVSLNVSPSEAELVIVNDNTPLTDVMRERAIYIFPDTAHGGKALCEAVWAATIRGMRFDNAHGFTIIILSPLLPRQQFDVRY